MRLSEGQTRPSGGQRRRARVLAGAVTLAFMLGGEVAALLPVFAAPPPPWSRVAAEISETLDRAAAAYAGGAPARGVELVSEAYFGHFEESGLEIAIRRYVSARRARELERMFAGIRQGITAGAPPDQVQRQVAALRTVLERSEEHTSELQSPTNLVC